MDLPKVCLCILSICILATAGSCPGDTCDSLSASELPGSNDPFCILFNCNEGYPVPCQDYACDSMTVREILDSNGLSRVWVWEVLTKSDETNRALTLNLHGAWDRADIEVLPESIAKLTTLKSINLAWNNLAKLPESIGRLSGLDTLDLSSNSLAKLPESIGQ